jgi:hypothetical protein
MSRHLGFGKGALIAVALTLSGIALTASCGDGGPDQRFVKGRTLEIYYEAPVIVQSLVYNSDGQDYLIEAEDPSKRIAVVKLIVANRNITHVPLRIDSESADIGNRRKSTKIKALDPYDDAVRERTDASDSDEVDRFTPFLWGSADVDKGFQAVGWMVFEIPVGLKLDSLWWKEADEILVKFDSPF